MPKLVHVLLAATLAACQTTATSSEANENALDVLNAAVLDWCDTQGGKFTLPTIGAPGCTIGDTLWAGTIVGVWGSIMEPDASWWWDKRQGLPPSLPFGVLWFVAANPKEFCVETQGAICPCPTAIAALNNPAQVPVWLIGPGAAACGEKQ